MTGPVPSNEDPGAGQACENTDRHLWPIVSKPDDPYESIHVTKDGNIGINVCGNVLVLPLREWHRRAGGTPGRAIGDEQRPSKDIVAELRATDNRPDFAQIYLRHLAQRAADEIERLQTALRGIQSCSTCEACRGAATLALGGVQPKPAHEREMPHCSTCSCPPYPAPEPRDGQ